MAITLAKAMQKRKAELQAEFPEQATVTEDKDLIRRCFLKWLGIELPEDAEVDIVEETYIEGYHLDVKFPGKGICISLREPLYVHNGHVCAWLLPHSLRWRTWQPGRGLRVTRCFNDFIDAVLYAYGEIAVDESGNLELRE